MKKLTTIIALVATLTLAGCAKKENKQESKKEYKQEVLKKEEVTVKTGDNKVYMKQTILIMSASVCILYATWKRKKRRH